MNNALLAIAALSVVCGIGSCLEHPQGRIVGGETVSAHFVPYQVSLRRRNGIRSAYAHSCGGAVLDERTIITAAHCVYNRLEQNFLVVAGSDVRTGMDGGIVTRVEKLVPHELYNASITDNDIALVFVSPPLPLGQRKIAAIELAEEVPAVGTVGSVSGWGLTKEDGFGSPQLQQVQIPLVDSTVCQAAYNWRPITEGMLCAAAPGGGKDACEGDAGGPLVVADKIVGIVSWGEGCARPEYPSVYASVPYFRAWIAEQRAKHA
ncbi:trypsin eta [Drosophila mojavensis]|uniref:trypsin n=1 Tax=Drosophila mojavensis TaxID=7230 RepID=B4KTX3_DROMO|nr:trypsin eta [Drosophila mojavensis]EDW10699.1 uncharacterized protein Dmoj_GI21246 [Drosophila mojavensis]